MEFDSDHTKVKTISNYHNKDNERETNIKALFRDIFILLFNHNFKAQVQNYPKIVSKNEEN